MRMLRKNDRIALTIVCCFDLFSILRLPVNLKAHLEISTLGVSRCLECLLIKLIIRIRNLTGKELLKSIKRQILLVYQDLLLQIMIKKVQMIAIRRTLISVANLVMMGYLILVMTGINGYS